MSDYIVAFLEGDKGLKAVIRCTTPEGLRLAVLERLQFAYGAEGEEIEADLQDELEALAGKVAGNLEALEDQIALIELYESQLLADLLVGRADHVIKQWPGMIE